jgi:hypothetical protein
MVSLIITNDWTNPEQLKMRELTAELIEKYLESSPSTKGDHHMILNNYIFHPSDDVFVMGVQLATSAISKDKKCWLISYNKRLKYNSEKISWILDNYIFSNDDITAIIAHEIGHIANGDVTFTNQNSIYIDSLKKIRPYILLLYSSVLGKCIFYEKNISLSPKTFGLIALATTLMHYMQYSNYQMEILADNYFIKTMRNKTMNMMKTFISCNSFHQNFTSLIYFIFVPCSHPPMILRLFAIWMT